MSVGNAKKHEHEEAKRRESEDDTDEDGHHEREKIWRNTQEGMEGYIQVRQTDTFRFMNRTKCYSLQLPSAFSV